MSGSFHAGEESQVGPYVSVVVVSRNDDHGKDLLARMQVFVNGLISQSIRYAVPSELVLVEWNPPADRPPLVEVLTWPDDQGWCPVRIITVPHTLHCRFAHSDQLPLFQMIAKNVGIRRAQGQFVLATNIDILLSDPLMTFLAQRRLLRRRLYRSDRIDVDRNVPVSATIAAQLAYCRTHVLRANRPDGIRFAPSDSTPHTVEEATLAAEDLGSQGRSGGVAPHRWLKKRLRLTAFGRFMSRLPIWRILKERRQVRLEGQLDNHSWRTPVIADALWPLLPLPDLHLLACGDFTLMARETWHEIGGNPELELYSLHLDSLMLYNASVNGVTEVRLPSDMVHYHIEHGGGWTPEGGHHLHQRLQTLGIPYLTQGDLAWLAHRLGHGGLNCFSSVGWGLADCMLPETLIVGGRIIRVPSVSEIQV